VRPSRPACGGHLRMRTGGVRHGQAPRQRTPNSLMLRCEGEARASKHAPAPCRDGRGGSRLQGSMRARPCHIVPSLRRGEGQGEGVPDRDNGPRKARPEGRRPFNRPRDQWIDGETLPLSPIPPHPVPLPSGAREPRLHGSGRALPACGRIGCTRTLVARLSRLQGSRRARPCHIVPSPRRGEGQGEGVPDRDIGPRKRRPEGTTENKHRDQWIDSETLPSPPIPPHPVPLPSGARERRLHGSGRALPACGRIGCTRTLVARPPHPQGSTGAKWTPRK
jgi:hypothetical protein